MCQLKWQRKKKKSRKIEAQYSIGVSACDQIKGCQALKCWISFPHDNSKGPYEPSAFPRHCSLPAMVLLPSQLETTSQTMWNKPHQPPPCFQPSLFPVHAWASSLLMLGHNQETQPVSTTSCYRNFAHERHFASALYMQGRCDGITVKKRLPLSSPRLIIFGKIRAVLALRDTFM